MKDLRDLKDWDETRCNTEQLFLNPKTDMERRVRDREAAAQGKIAGLGQGPARCSPPRDAIKGYRGTSLIRSTPLLGPYSRTIPEVLW